MKLLHRTASAQLHADEPDNPLLHLHTRLSGSERQQLAAYLHVDEHIKAAIRGRQFSVGEVVLIATDQRVLLLRDTPLFSKLEVLSYELITGISLQRGANVVSSICLYTTIQPYQLDYVNNFAANKLLKYIESRIYTPHGSLIHSKGGMTAMG